MVRSQLLPVIDVVVNIGGGGYQATQEESQKRQLADDEAPTSVLVVLEGHALYAGVENRCSITPYQNASISISKGAHAGVP
jgi:hypothetical protein